MQTAHFRSDAPLGHPNVDRANGIIRDVSIITEGPARGHGVFCDRTTLEQVKAKAEDRGQGGLAVKFNPQTFDHGPGGIAGFFADFRIDGAQLVANLHLEPEFSAFGYLLNLAEKQPNSFGLSIDFDMYGETLGDKTFARCAQIDAVTVVDVPAANASGLFSVGKQKLPVDAPPRKSQAQIVIAANRPKKLSATLFSK